MNFVTALVLAVVIMFVLLLTCSYMEDCLLFHSKSFPHPPIIELYMLQTSQLDKTSLPYYLAPLPCNS